MGSRESGLLESVYSQVPKGKAFGAPSFSGTDHLTWNVGHPPYILP